MGAFLVATVLLGVLGVARALNRLGTSAWVLGGIAVVGALVLWGAEELGGDAVGDATALAVRAVGLGMIGGNLRPGSGSPRRARSRPSTIASAPTARAGWR